MPGRKFWFVVALAVVLTAAPAAAEEEPPELSITGSGRGHGVGMSQWGAKGQADAGRTAEEILTFYYTDGAAVGTLDEQLPADHRLLVDKNPTWVSVRRSVTELEFGAVDGELIVCTGPLGCAFVAGPGELWQFATVGDGTCLLTVDGVAATDPGPCSATVRGMRPDGPLLDVAGTANPDLFARGRLKIRSADEGATLHAMIALPLEDYVRGVNEVPFAWASGALEAQAIAARSFGVYKNLIYGPEPEFSDERKELCWCHLFASVNDQVYSGWRTETAAEAERWTAAVEATEGTVMVHPASPFFDVAQTFYSAANGGASENSEDVFIDAVPYLRSVPDPWTPAAEGNPYDVWEHRFTEDEAAASFGVDRVDGIHIVERFDSGTPSRIDIWTRTGDATEVIEMEGIDLARSLDLTGRHTDDVTYGSIDPLVGDFTGDGTPDVTMLLDFNKAFWVGDGSTDPLTMTPWTNLALHFGWQEPVTGDFDGDGRHDVAVYNTQTGRWSVGLSDAGFVFDRWGGHGESPDAWSNAVVADFDGDGLDDIAHHNRSSGAVRVFRSTGSDFAAKRWHRFAANAAEWAAVLAGDYDGDDRADIAFIDPASGSVTVLFSYGETFRAHSWATMPAGSALTVVRGDADGDGRDDLVSHDGASGEWTVALAGPLRTADRVARWARTTLAWSFVIPGDFDGDGDDDVAVFDEAGRRWKVLSSDGERFTVAKWGKSRGNAIFTEAFAADADGDGDADLLVWSEQRRKWWLLDADDSSFDQRGVGRLFG